MKIKILLMALLMSVSALAVGDKDKQVVAAKNGSDVQLDYLIERLKARNRVHEVDADGKDIPNAPVRIVVPQDLRRILTNGLVAAMMERGVHRYVDRGMLPAIILQGYRVAHMNWGRLMDPPNLSDYFPTREPFEIPVSAIAVRKMRPGAMLKLFGTDI